MFGGYQAQGVLQGSKQTIIQQSPVARQKEEVSHKGPKDEIDLSMVEGDEVYTLKKCLSELKNTGIDNKKTVIEADKADKSKDNKKQEKSKGARSKDINFSGGEQTLRKLENTGCLVCEEGDDNTIKVVTKGTVRDTELTPQFLTGNKGEIPSAEAAIVTAQTIIEKELTDNGKEKLTALKKCPDTSKIIPVMEKFDKTLADIVVKNDPILIPVE